MAVGARFLFWMLRQGGGSFHPPVPPAAPAYDLFWPGLGAMTGIDWPGTAAPIDWPGI